MTVATKPKRQRYRSVEEGGKPVSRRTRPKARTIKNNWEWYCDPEKRYDFINDFVFDISFTLQPSRTWLWPKLVDVIDSVYNNKNTVVVSANGIGKTFVSSVIVTTFLCTNPDSIVVTTAPTWTQVEKLLWGEIRDRFGKSKHKLVSCAINQTSINISDKWYAIGLSTNEEPRFQGFHAKKILVVVDEASGVDRKIWKAISGILNSDGARLLAIGNPNTKDCRFFELTQLPGYNVIAIPAWEHPNYKAAMEVIRNYDDEEWQAFDENKKLDLLQYANVIPGAVSYLGCEAIANDYGGYKSQVYQVRVAAQFPEDEDDVLIPYGAIMKHVINEQTDKPNKACDISGALDVARKGKCETVMTLRQGNFVFPQKSWRGKTLDETEDLVEIYLGELKYYEYFNIDADGIGAGVYDHLVRRRQKVRDFHGGLPAVNKDRFVNRRSELYYNLRMKFLDSNRDSILIPNDPVLIAQLNAMRLAPLDAKGRIRVESKDDMEARGIASPDRADSLMMSEDTFIGHDLDYFQAGDKLEALHDAQFETTEEDDEGAFVNGSLLAGKLNSKWF